MFSVTKRIELITQPHGGYVNPKSFKTIELIGFERIKDIPTIYKSIQGLAVDYLTRFMSGFPKEEAFKISLLGANALFESDNADKLLDNIKGLDTYSISNACKLVCYDTAYRMGPSSYAPCFNNNEPDEELISNIKILVKRALSFFEDYGPIVKSGFTFESGYTKIVSTGDGDFLTKDTLWDFKVSQTQLSSKQTLQLLMYYILGYNSIHKEFKEIKKLGIFNPLLNIAYLLDISEIPDETFNLVSHLVLGCDIPDEPNGWKKPLREHNGCVKTDNDILSDTAIQFYYDRYHDTGFRPDKYVDGIHDITVDDYWTYYRDKSRGLRPKFPYTRSVKFLKHNNFLMFISVSSSGSTCILQGGKLRKIQKPIQYYYDNMIEYGNLILDKFSKYWNTLYSIANQLKSVAPDKEKVRKTIYAEYVQSCKNWGFKILDFEEWYEEKKDSISFSCKVHGCIIDLDYHNHIYVNPYDGTIAPYFAMSKYLKNVYKNVASLLSEKRPEMIEDFKNTFVLNKDETTSLVVANSSKKNSLSNLSEDEIDLYNVSVTDVSMYNISDRMKLLQSIYDYKLIEVWYDDILPHYEIEGNVLENKNASMVGQSNRMKCGMEATVIEDTGDTINIEFEDGTIIKDCQKRKFLKGTISNPNISKNKQLESSVNKIKEVKEKTSYVGKTKTMNCGLKATVIEDFGYKNITIQFEDGLIRKNCRRDKFKEGKIAHRE